MRKISQVIIQNQRGMSLIQLMVSLSIIGIIAASVGYLMETTVKMSNRASLQDQLNREHLVALLQLRQKANIIGPLNLNTPQAQQCFGRHRPAADCGGLTVGWTAFTLANGAAAAANSPIDHVTEYRISCQATYCNEVELRVQSSVRANYLATHNLQTMPSPKTATFSMPGSVLVDRQQIDFSCVNGATKLVNSMSSENLKADCLQLPVVTDCSAQGPFRNFGGAAADCQPMANQACGGAGINVIGFFQGEVQCTPAGNDTILPP